MLREKTKTKRSGQNVYGSFWVCKETHSRVGKTAVEGAISNDETYKKGEILSYLVNHGKPLKNLREEQ